MTPRPQKPRRQRTSSMQTNDDKLYRFFGHHTSLGTEATWFPLASVGIHPKATPKGSWLFRAFGQGKIRVLVGGDGMVRMLGVIVACVFRGVVYHLNHFLSSLEISHTSWWVTGPYIYLVPKPCMSSCPEHVICHSADWNRVE